MRGVCGVVSSREARPRDVEPPRVAPKYLVARVGPSTREVSLLGVSTDGSEAGASRGGGVSRLATSSDDRRRRRSVHGRVFRAPRARGGGACDGRSGEAHAPRRRDSPRAPPLPPGLERPRPRGALGFHVRPRARPDAPPRRPFGGARGVPRPRRPSASARARWRVTLDDAGVSWTVHDLRHPTRRSPRGPSRAAATSSPRTLHPGTRGASGGVPVAGSPARRRRRCVALSWSHAAADGRAMHAFARGLGGYARTGAPPKGATSLAASLDAAPATHLANAPRPDAPSTRRVRARLRDRVRVRVPREPPEASIADPSRRASVRCGMARRGGSSVAAVRSRSRGDVGVDATPRNSTGRFHVGERRRGGVRVDAL